MENTGLSDASLQKILISYSEFERLKNIEAEHSQCQSKLAKTLQINTDSEKPSTSKQSENQSGEGSSIANKLHLLLQGSGNEEDVFEHLANIVSQKIQNTSQTTSLFQPKETFTTIEVTTPNTNPPIGFSNPIRKMDENDSFGKSLLF